MVTPFDYPGRLIDKGRPIIAVDLSVLIPDRDAIPEKGRPIFSVELVISVPDLA
jgi:hypothetical protein